jgi:uncharacterized membrane protein (Fun14 family)
MTGPAQRQVERGPANSPKEDYVSSVSAAGGQSNKRLIAIVLAVVGVLFLILGIIYVAIPEEHLPSLLGYKAHSTGHHALRMTASFIVAAVCFAAAWFVNRSGKSAGKSDSSSGSGSAGDSSSVDAPANS